MINTKLIKDLKYSNEILNLRNKSYCLSQSFNEKIIKKKNHELWLRKFIKDQNIMYGIFNKKKFIG